MLGALLYGLVAGASKVNDRVESERSKRDTAYVNEKGQTICYDNKCCRYVNGEPTYRLSQEDKYGRTHLLTIGRNSGKVYEDSADKKDYFEEVTERAYKYAIDNGKLAYEDYTDPRFRPKGVVKEISTGKIIHCLWEYTNHKTGQKEYRKWYLTKEYYKRFGKSSVLLPPEEGDGILITKDEYWKLGGSGAMIRFGVRIPDPKIMDRINP